MLSRSFARTTLRPVHVCSKVYKKPLFTTKFVRHTHSESSENSKILGEVQQLLKAQSNELCALKSEQALMSRQLKFIQDSCLS